MQNLYFDHPPEDVLERFLLHQCQEEELETVETHVLACEACVSRLEELQTQIAAIKLALNNLEAERSAKPTPKPRTRWATWLTAPNLTWAGAAAALAFGLFVVPQLTNRTTPAAEVNLSAYRGLESSIVPPNRPLHLVLNASDLSNGPVTVQVVNNTGDEIWKGAATAHRDRVDVTVPRLTKSGAHFVRIYAPTKRNGEGNLLCEFAVEVK